MRNQFLLNIQNPVIRDHRILGRHLLPGLAYIDLLYQAFRAHGYSHNQIELANFTIYRPLFISGESPFIGAIDCVEVNPHEWKVEVRRYSTSANWLDDSESLYATANVFEKPIAGFDEVVNFAEVIASAAAKTTFDDIYASFRKGGLNHGTYMRATGMRYLLTDEIYVDCTLSEDALKDASRAMFHPVLLDGSALCMQGIIDDAKSNDVFVPLYFESFSATSLLQRGCWARARTSVVQSKNDLRYATLEFFDHSGAKVAELKNLIGKETRGKLADAQAHNEVPQVPVVRNVHRATDLVAGKASEAGSTLEAILAQAVANALNVPVGEVDTNGNFYELGLASLQLLELTTSIAKIVGKAIPPTLLFEYTTIAEVAASLDAEWILQCRSVDSQQSVVSATDAKKTDVAGFGAVGKTEQAGFNTPDCVPYVDKGTAIIGLAGRFPGAATVVDFWNNLKGGVDSICQVPPHRWSRPLHVGTTDEGVQNAYSWGGFIEDVDKFDALFFFMSPYQAELTDPQSRLFLETVWDLFESACYTRDIIKERYKSKVGVYVGAMYQHYNLLAAAAQDTALPVISSYSVIANRVSHFFGLQGPSAAIDTACSSSATAIHSACKDLAANECELAVAGGVNLSLHPEKYRALFESQLLSSDANVRSFGRGAGYLPAESVGAVLLKPLSRALDDGDQILAVIRSSAINHAGNSSAFGAANLAAQAQVIVDTLVKAKVDARTIGYVEAAANGSALGDAIEIRALTKAFRTYTSDLGFCKVGSAKSNIGHAEAASTVSQLAKVVLQLREHIFVPTIKADPINPDIDFQNSPFQLQHSLTKWPQQEEAQAKLARNTPRRALVNAFGAGGTYVCLLVEEYVRLEAENYIAAGLFDGSQLILLSAQSHERLLVVVQRLLDFLCNDRSSSLSSIAYTLQVGRESLDCRLALLVRDRADLENQLRLVLQEQGTQQALATLGGMTVAGPTTQAIHASTVEIARLIAAKDLKQLGLLWMKGSRVLWRGLYDRNYPHIYSLPTYPFARTRCWVGADSQFKSEAGRLSSRAGAAMAPNNENQVQLSTARDAVKKFLAKTLKLEPDAIQDDKHLRAYGVDSIITMRLAHALGHQFGIVLDSSVVAENLTVNALANCVDHLRDIQIDCRGAADADHESIALVEQMDTSFDGRNGAADEADALEQFKLGKLSAQDIEKMLRTGVIA